MWTLILLATKPVELRLRYKISIHLDQYLLSFLSIMVDRTLQTKDRNQGEREEQ